MKQNLITDIAWGGGLIVLALGATLTRKLSYIDAETVTRVVIGAIGLMVVYYGNRAPKAVAPSASAGRATRVAGWALVLSGLVYAALWAFAPIPVAATFGTGAVALGLAVMLGYCLWLRARAKAV